MEMADAENIRGQRYSSFRIPYEFVALPGQTVLPTAPPRTHLNHRPSRHVFTVEDDSNQDEETRQSRDTKKYFKICVLAFPCIFMLVVGLGLVIYSAYTLYNIVVLSSVSNDVPDSTTWMFRDETTLCVTIPGKNMRHSGCSQYLLKKIKDDTNYTCCVRDSSTYIFLFDLALDEIKRVGSGVKNKVCTHSHTKGVSSDEKGVMVWLPTQHCELNNKMENTTHINIPSSDMFTIYFSITVSFGKSYLHLANDNIRLKLFRQGALTKNTDSEVLVYKMLKIRKEWQNYVQLFFYGTFQLNRNDKLYVKVWNKKYIYDYEQHCSFGFYKI